MPKLNAMTIEALIPVVVLIVAPLVAAFVSPAVYDLLWWLLPLSTIGAGIFIILRYDCYRRYLAIGLTLLAVAYTFWYEYHRYTIDYVHLTGSEVKRFDGGGDGTTGSSRDVFLLMTREELQFRNEDEFFPSFKFDTARLANRAQVQAEVNNAAYQNNEAPTGEWIVSRGIRFTLQSLFPNAIMLTEGFPFVWMYYFSMLNTIFALPFYLLQWLTWRVVMRFRIDVEDTVAATGTRANEA